MGQDSPSSATRATLALAGYPLGLGVARLAVWRTLPLSGRQKMAI